MHWGDSHEGQLRKKEKVEAFGRQDIARFIICFSMNILAFGPGYRSWGLQIRLRFVIRNPKVILYPWWWCYLVHQRHPSCSLCSHMLQWHTSSQNSQSTKSQITNTFKSTTSKRRCFASCPTHPILVNVCQPRNPMKKPRLSAGMAVRVCGAGGGGGLIWGQSIDLLSLSSGCSPR